MIMDKYFLRLTAVFSTVFLICTCKEPARMSLFNGVDLTGWEIKAKPQDIDKKYWKVENGYIEANSLGDPDHDYVWLVTEREYSDFEFSFKFQAFRESPGNSGVQVRSRYDEKNYWLNGPQIDIHPTGFWRTGMMWDETRGNQRWIFPDIKDGGWVGPDMALSHPSFYYSDEGPGWNEMNIKVEGLQISAYLNGDKVTDFNGKGILDDENHRKLKVGETGFIAFQIHTGDELKIRIKDIFIKELN